MKNKLPFYLLPIALIMAIAGISKAPAPWHLPAGFTSTITEIPAYAGTSNQLLGSAAAAASFTPANLTGLQLYMDPNNAGSKTLSGTDVSTWTDLSSNADVFTGTGVSEIPQNHPNTLNGKTCISFSLKSGFTDSGALDILGDGTHPFTIWFVTKNVTFPFSSFSFVFTGISTTVGAGKAPQIMYAHSSQTGYTNLFWGGVGSGGPFKVARATTAFSTPSTAYVATLTYDGSATLAGTQWYSANVSQTTATGTDNGQTSSVNIIGDAPGIGFNSLNGDLCSFVVQRATLNSTDRTNMETYYTAQFGSISP